MARLIPRYCSVIWRSFFPIILRKLLNGLKDYRKTRIFAWYLYSPSDVGCEKQFTIYYSWKIWMTKKQKRHEHFFWWLFCKFSWDIIVPLFWELVRGILVWKLPSCVCRDMVILRITLSTKHPHTKTYICFSKLDNFHEKSFLWSCSCF